jgi:hypothetical protein
MTEFRDKARPAELGDPATDRPLTYRVHPDDDPRDPNARRIVKTDDIEPAWVPVTGCDVLGEVWLGCCDVADWPYTNHALASAAFAPPDPCRTFTFDGLAGVAECSCGVLGFTLRDRTHAGHWHATHRNATARSAERGDLDVAAFKGTTA